MGVEMSPQDAVVRAYCTEPFHGTANLISRVLNNVDGEGKKNKRHRRRSVPIYRVWVRDVPRRRDDLLAGTLARR